MGICGPGGTLKTARSVGRKSRVWWVMCVGGGWCITGTLKTVLGEIVWVLWYICGTYLLLEIMI
jgi:hypothetical protein